MKPDFQELKERETWSGKLSVIAFNTHFSTLLLQLLFHIFPTLAGSFFLSLSLFFSSFSSSLFFSLLPLKVLLWNIIIKRYGCKCTEWAWSSCLLLNLTGMKKEMKGKLVSEKNLFFSLSFQRWINNDDDQPDQNQCKSYSLFCLISLTIYDHKYIQGTRRINVFFISFNSKKFTFILTLQFWRDFKGWRRNKKKEVLRFFRDFCLTQYIKSIKIRLILP